MRTPASRILLVLTSAVVVAAVTTGCGMRIEPAAPAAGSPGTTPSTVESTEPAAESSKVSKRAGGRKAAVAACRADDVQSDVIAPDHRTRGAVRMAILNVANVSRHACRLGDGFAGQCGRRGGAGADQQGAGVR